MNMSIFKPFSPPLLRLLAITHQFSPSSTYTHFHFHLPSIPLFHQPFNTIKALFKFIFLLFLYTFLKERGLKRQEEKRIRIRRSSLRIKYLCISIFGFYFSLLFIVFFVVIIHFFLKFLVLNMSIM